MASENTRRGKPIICVVIPAYCAAEHLEKVVNGLPNFVDYSIIVDDCSSDQTWQVAEQLAEVNPKVKLVRHTLNQGVGGAVLSGYQAASQLNATVVVKMDSDDQMDPRFLPRLIAPILKGEADYTKGNRFLHSVHLNSMPVLRRIGNLSLSFITKMASGYWDIFDPTNGYTAIHGAIIPLLDAVSIDKRYFFETSLLMQLYLLRAVVKDVPIPARYGNEASHLSEMKSVFEFPPRLIKGLFNRIWMQYFIKDFNLFAVFMLSGICAITFGFFFGLYHWIYSVVNNTFASTGTIMVAVLPLILGVQFVLQGIVLDVQNMPRRPLHLEDDDHPGNLFD